MSNNNEIALLHVFGQAAHHDDVCIVGNSEGIRNLFIAVEAALKLKSEASIDVFTNDGEGYTVMVKIDERLKMHEGNYAVPYHADWAKERRKNAIYPWTTTTQTPHKRDNEHF